MPRGSSYSQKQIQKAELFRKNDLIPPKFIWLNLELAKFPPSSLEYIILHEVVHLLERLHNKRFYGYLDGFMPEWRQVWKALKAWPLG
ncbi:MAG: M48 family metallopeptidase [Anaerolineales bacterium]|nr:M48 family metallopeptidase [Anaerolineales bacterium]